MNACLRKAALYCLIALVSAGALAGCSRGNTTSDTDLVDISMDGVRKALASSDEDERAILLDVRSQEQFRDGYIEGAVSAPITSLIRDDIRLQNVETIIVYGDDFDDVLGPAAAKKLRAYGYENVLLYRGGLADWKKKGGSTNSLR